MGIHITQNDWNILSLFEIQFMYLNVELFINLTTTSLRVASSPESLQNSGAINLYNDPEKFKIITLYDYVHN